MAYTQAQLDALQAALASGTLRVEYEDRAITYRSLDELQEAIQVVTNALNPPLTAGSQGRSFAKFSKGL